MQNFIRENWFKISIIIILIWFGTLLSNLDIDITANIDADVDNEHDGTIYSNYEDTFHKYPGN